MRRWMAWLPRAIAGALILSNVTVANAALVIKWDMGGELDDFILKYQTIDEAEGKVDVEGMCVSACTLVLGLVDASRVCAGPKAVFGFHSAFEIDPKTRQPKFSTDGTFIAWWIYPPLVQKALIKHGWKGPTFPHPDLIFIPASELGVTPCKS